MGPWQDQGTVVEQEEQKRSFWDWWEDNGDTAVGAAGDIMRLFSPNSPRCRPNFQQNGQYYVQRQDNTLLYVLIGAILFLVLLLILKK